MERNEKRRLDLVFKVLLRKELSSAMPAVYLSSLISWVLNSQKFKI